MGANNQVMVAALATLALTLSACGGGGSDSVSPAASVTSFALQAGFRARIQGGATDNFAVSGTCTGTSALTTGSAAPSTFEGVAGSSSTQTQSVNLSNCTPATNAVTGTAYFDSNFTPLGTSIPGVEYTKFTSAPGPLPSVVRIGDTSQYAIVNVYTDATKSTLTGQRQLSFVVEADSSTTALVTFITRSFNTSSQLLFVQQTKYRMAGDGTLTMVSIDVQFNTTSANHFVYTKV